MMTRYPKVDQKKLFKFAENTHEEKIVFEGFIQKWLLWQPDTAFRGSVL